MRIRDARPEDAAAACAVLRRSITELCVADHRGDPTVLAAWLANKTPDGLARWIARPDQSVMLTVDDGDTVVLAVGAVSDAGEVTLNYVAPEARLQGVSRAMLRALEARAAARGAARCTLTSTETARRFYLSAGYAEEARPSPGGAGRPMSKPLPAAAAPATR